MPRTPSGAPEPYSSVLVERMLAERDFERFEPLWFSTSQAGGRGPAVGFDTPPVGDAPDMNSLKKLEIVVSCQGGDSRRRCTDSCVARAGRATGSMPLRRCAWSRTRSSCSIP